MFVVHNIWNTLLLLDLRGCCEERHPVDFFHFFLPKMFKKGGSVPIPSMSSAVPAKPQIGGQATEDRYAALAELDNKMSTVVSTGSNVQG